MYTNLPQDYFVSLVKAVFKHCDYKDKFNLGIAIEKTAMKIASENQSLKDAKLNLIATISARGEK